MSRSEVVMRARASSISAGRGPGGWRCRGRRIFRARPGAEHRWVRAWRRRSPWSRCGRLLSRRRRALSAIRWVEARVNAPRDAEGVEHRDAQRAAFFGIGGAAEFVDQHQRIRRGAFQHRADRHDVGGEGAEAFLNRLVVADVGQHLVEQAGTRLRRRERGGRRGPSARAGRRFSARPSCRRCWGR